MSRLGEVCSKTSRNHEFDFLRIVFASLVLLAHAPEITDGDRSRELFCRLTHSDVTFGVVAVDGFFLLSGFLIVQSWIRTPRLGVFLRNRLLRIVPGYAVAATLGIFVVGLLAPGVDSFFHHLSNRTVQGLMTLGSPWTPDVFPGLHYQIANGALWTIPYEFRCYLLVAACGWLGMYRRPVIWLAATIVLFADFALPGAVDRMHWPHVLQTFVGPPDVCIRLTSIFGVGACFALFRDSIKFRPFTACALVGLSLFMGSLRPYLVEPALVLCGAYLMFYLGEKRTQAFRWMKNIPDISYGIYLYGWPVESLWIWYRHGTPWIAFAASLSICIVLGWLSWHFVEKPVLKLKRKKHSPVLIPSLELA